MSNKSEAPDTVTQEAVIQDDIIIVQTRRVSCDGGGGALGHPKVWMDMGQDSEVECKYCDRVFRLDPKAGDSH